MYRQIKIAFRFTALSTLGLGIVFPLLLTSVGFFIPSSSPTLSINSIQEKTLFQNRPSMSGGTYSGASNLSLTNPKLWKQVEERLKQASSSPIAHELLFASASGYDPHISVQGALCQIPRIAQICHIDKEILEQLVKQHIQSKLWGFIGTEKINVFKINEDLKKLEASSKQEMFHKSNDLSP